MATLYIVSTPIGNLDDITIRALNILKASTVIFAEDTRVTQKLLQLLKIDYTNKTLVSNFEHNEIKRVDDALKFLSEGNDITLVTDAGTPLISDPGFPLVRRIREYNEGENKILIEIIPGVSSVITALVGSGFPTDKFTFLGYVPRKPSDRKKMFQNIRKSNNHIRSTYIFFESHFRLESTLNVIVQMLPTVNICIARELTKSHEEFIYGNPEQIIGFIKSKSLVLKGEFVVILSLNKE